MPHWLIKSTIHRVISWLPNSGAWNELFQKYVTRSIVLTPEQFTGKLGEARRYLEHQRQFTASTKTEFTVLEVGTGWHPTIPLALYLCGAGDIWTFDIDSHLSRSRLTQLLDLFMAADTQGRLVRLLPRLIKSRMEHLRAWRSFAAREGPEAWLKRLQIHAAVCDARNTGLKPGSVDFIFSSGVLEYIPPAILRDLMREFRRVASSRAVMVHRLNLVDQFAYFDKSLSPFHHLKYTEEQHRRWSSPLIWQNRLRVSDYRRLLAETGFTLKAEDSTSGAKVDLDRVEVSLEFLRYTTEDVLVLHSMMAAVPDATFSTSDRG
jgi:hypothetical protein